MPLHLYRGTVTYSSAQIIQPTFVSTHELYPSVHPHKYIQYIFILPATSTRLTQTQVKLVKLSVFLVVVGSVCVQLNNEITPTINSMHKQWHANGSGRSVESRQTSLSLSLSLRTTTTHTNTHNITKLTLV